MASISKILDFYKLTAEDIIVLHDEIDLPAGKYKIATDSSSAGHNGVQNIIDQIGTQTFKRVRIGIGEDSVYNYRLYTRGYKYGFTPDKLTYYM